MPGYKSLPLSLQGATADHVRSAEASTRIGDAENALDLLEEALHACMSDGVPLPGWLCGRLAALYRTLERFDDEVRLLEDYRDTQVVEDARTRFDARLCKARTIAERRRRRDNGALASVRDVIARPRYQRPGPHDVRTVVTESPFSAETRSALWLAVTDTASTNDAMLDLVLRRLNAESQSAAVPVEAMLALFKHMKARLIAQGAGEMALARYTRALTRMLSVHFDSAVE